MKSYRKPMELSDLQAIEKALFQQYYDKIDEDIILLADNDDASDIEALFGEPDNFTDNSDNWREPVFMENDFSVEEILDMPTEPELLSEHTQTNIDSVGHKELCKNESHCECKHELFCVAKESLNPKYQNINVFIGKQEKYNVMDFNIYCDSRNQY